MSNSNCINCKRKRGLDDRCVCNNERRCGNCKFCSWCVDNKQNGKCVPNNQYNIENCPYSFNKNWKETKHLDKNYYFDQEYDDDDENLSIYKYIYFIILILLLIIIIIYLIFKKQKSCP